MTVQALITVTLLTALAGWAVLIAVRAMRRQIADDAAASGDWSGAQRFGGGFGEAGRPPPEEIVRKHWTPVRPVSTGPFSKTHAEGLSGTVSRASLERFATWCDRKCEGGWVLVVADAAPVTVWFERSEDAERFTANWLPVRAN